MTETMTHHTAPLPARREREKSALETAAAIRSGATTVLAETEAAIARIEARDGALNAVIVRDFDNARQAAAALDARIRSCFDAPLLGVPMTIKESYDIAGLPTTYGFAEHAGFIAQEDAVVVKRLKAAGAIFLGKTNVPPALSDLQSNNPVYGRTNNAVNPDRVAGGSSGGSAVALGADMVPLEFGSDIGGSIRVPAAFNGVWGHKPTWGVIPTEGHYFPGTDSARSVLSVLGPMARDADDLETALDVVADHPLAPANRHGHSWRVLILTSHPMAKVQGSIVAALESLGEAFSADGATVDRTSDLLPDLERQHAGYWQMLNIAMSRRGPLSEGQQPPALETWLHLHDEQARIQRQWRRLFETYDAVIAPAVGMTAFGHDDTPLATRRLSIDGEDTQFFHQFAFPGLATFPMLPATSVPIGKDADGLPIGVQVIADLYADRTAIAAAAAAHDLAWSAR
ncbi:amidase family protein [Sphingomonas jeddahensis]|uniref:Biuret hydrolase n=1 Tax=Sphingomonas jeddahensis TaxID=1915074 RepID=A0A1V2EYF4_9SPHN|nr:amidase family protein [Sphingomonas jeddahensis]ONF97702.1 Biuret hydrolase [Sphingomonas jeddahensis]